MTTLVQFYEQIGGNYEEALARLMNETLMNKFVHKYTADTSFSDLETALADGELDVAFRAAHTLKGVAYNLGFNPLGDAASTLTEALREGNEDQRIEENLAAMFTEVKLQHDKCIEAISALD